MKTILFRILIAGVCVSILPSNKAFSQVVFTALPGNASIYLTQGTTNQVVYGFSVTVPAFGFFNPGPLHIGASSSINGFVSGNLIRTTTNNPALAISAPQASYGLNINSTLDANGFPSLTGGFTATTYYFYVVLSITTTANPSPASLVFSLPSSGSISQNGYFGGITVNNTASPVTYYFGVAPPTVPAASNCGTGAVTLTASDSPAGGTFSWYNASSGGTLLQSSASTTYSPTIAATTTYYVSYTSGTKTSTRTAVTATINPIPVSTFTVTSPVNVNTSSMLNLTAAYDAAATYNYNLNGGTIVSGSGSGPYGVQWTTPGVKTVTLSVTNAAGCTSTLSSQTVTVLPAAPTTTGGSSCGTGTVTLTAAGGSPTGGTYNWYAASSGGTALQISTASTYTTPSISATTTYYVSYTSGGAESNRTAATATINPAPLSTFTASASTAALNTNVTFTYTGSDPATSTYTWNFNGGTIVSGSGQGPYAIKWTTPGSKTVTLSVTNAAGCTSTLSSQTVTVQPAAPSATGGSVCGTGTVTLTAAGGSPTGGTYNWYAASSGGTALQSSTATTYTTPSISATSTYYVSYTSGGAESSRTAVTATVNPVPLSTFTTSAATAVVNTSVTITYTGSDPSTSTYTWNFNGGTTISGSGQGPYNIKWTTPGVKTITLAVTNASGCTSATTSNTVTVTVPAAPTAIGGSSCGAGTVTLTASGGSPAGGTYNWYAASSGGTALQSSTSTTYSPNLLTTATYYVSYTSGGVESTRTAVTATINPVVSSPYAGAAFSYPFSGNTNDVSGNGNNGLNTSATLTTDRFGAANSAYSFNGSSQYISSSASGVTSPTVFSISLWFNTTTAGGKLIGFGSSQTGASTTYDRHLYMSSSGQLYFGVYNGAFTTINTTASYNDGNWHHVIINQGASGAGTSLYVDGTLQASNTSLVPTVNYTGYWRIGYDALNTALYPTASSNPYFTGNLDDIAVYSRVLTAAEISSSNNLYQIGAYAPVCAGNPLTLYAPTITGATYTWTDPAGNTATGQNPTFATAIAGNYTLNVTGGPGGCSSTATVTPVVNPLPTAAFTASSPVNVGARSTITYSGVYIGTSTYTWNFNGGTIVKGAGAGPYTVQWATAGSKTVTLLVTTNSGCTATSTQTVIVAAAPTAANVSNCGAGTVTLTASGGSPAGGTYNWYAASSGGTALQSSTSTTYSPALLATSTYYVSYTSVGGESARTPVTATINPVVSSPYAGAAFSYPFSGNTNDVSGNGDNGIATGGPTLTSDRFGAVNSAYSFNGSSQYMSATALVNNPNVFTLSLWFNTTTAGGKLLGFGSSQTGASGSNDRHIYMSASGQLYYGIYQSNTVYTINTTASYNDGNWHHVIVTMGSDGSTLYVDGTVQASNSAMTTGQNYTGYWRIGYDNENGWPGTTADSYFTGKLDDIAVYNRELSAAEIASSNNLNQIGTYTSACAGSPITLYAPTITGATYTWTDPLGNTATGQNPTFASAAAGNYSLTVTGGPGGCSSSATVPVTVTTASATFTASAGVLVGSNAGIQYTGTETAASTYTWNFGGGTVVSGSGQGPYQVNWATTGTKTITLTVVSATTGCTGTSTQTVTVSSTAATYGNYAFRKTVTLNTAAVGITSNLANFPALLSIQDNDLIISGTCTDKLAIPSGPNYDFAFVDPSSPATELYYQVENYNQTTGTLLVWVQIPNVSSAANNTLSFYYGSKSPLVTHNTAFFQKTWTSDYQVVYHFNESAYSGTTLDGTANNRTATLVGFQATDYTAAGKIGSCYTFGGTAGSPTVNDMEAPTAPATTAFTLSAWVKMSTGGLDEKVISDQGPSGNSSGGYKLGVYVDNTAETEDYGNLDRVSWGSTPASPALSVGTWYHIQGVYNGSTISTYVNGVQYQILASTGNTFLTSTLYIGIGEGKQYPFSGLIDEPRVSNIAKTSDWIKMEYVDQNNPVAFTSISSTRYTNVPNAAAVPGFLTYTWTGGSTNITSAANWNNTTAGTTGQAPAFDGSATLVIPAGLSNYPVLTANESLFGLSIANGASVNLNGFNLNIGCDITNSSGGQILYGGNYASGITWNGSLATQHYYGSATAATGQTGNMVVNNSAAGTVSIASGGLDVYNTITMTSGNLAVGASAALTLKSSAAQTAGVAAIPTGSAITGNVTAERFVTGGTSKDPSTNRWTYRNYRLLSSPVNEGVDASGHYPYSLNYIAAGTIVTDATSTFGSTGGNPSMYLFNESRTPSSKTFTSGNFDGVTNISATTAAGQISTTDASYPSAKVYAGDGVMVYFRGNNINYLTGSPSKTSAPYVAPESVTFSTTGLLNQGAYAVTSWTGTAGLMFSTAAGNASVRGFNLVGNPYPSSIDWSLFSNSNSAAPIYGPNVNPSIYILNPRTDNYDVYSAATGIATGNASNVIPSGQGFFVQANSPSPSLTFNEAAKTAAQVTGNNLLMGKPVTQTAYQSYMRLLLVSDSVNFNDIVIGFNSSATPIFNPAVDAQFFPGYNAVESLSASSADSVKASVKWLPLPKAGNQLVVPLNVAALESGIHSLNRTDLKQLPELYEVWLMDKLKNDSLDLRHNTSYAFNLDKTDSATFGSKRFQVLIRQDPARVIHLLNFTAAKAAAGSQLVWLTENEQNYTNFTVERSTDGGKSFQILGGVASADQGTYAFLDKNPAQTVDLYRLMIQDIDGNISYSKIIPVSYATLANNIALSGISVYPNPATTTLNLTVNHTPATGNAYAVTVVNSSGMVIKNDVFSQNTWIFNVGNLLPGSYIIRVTNNSNKNLVGTGKFTKL